MSTLSERMQDLALQRQRLYEFNAECEAEEYTDTGEAWDLLNALDIAITDALKAYNPARYT